MAAGKANEAFAAFHAAIQAAPASVVPRVRLGNAFVATTGAIGAHPCYWTAWIRLSLELGHSEIPRGLKSFRLRPRGKVVHDPQRGLVLEPYPGTTQQVGEAWPSSCSSASRCARNSRRGSARRRRRTRWRTSC